MTPEQLTAIGDSLKAQPAAWQDLPVELQAALTEYFDTRPFTDEIRRWLSKWVMGPVSDEQKQEIETLYADAKPVTSWQGRIAADGKRYYGADLLTDALDGRRLSALLPALQGLTLRDVDSIVWPKPQPEEL
jgi:hypothetical protein